MASGRPSIGTALHARVEATLRDHPELGYQTTSELIKDLLRRWLEIHDAGGAVVQSSSEDAESDTQVGTQE